MSEGASSSNVRRVRRRGETVVRDHGRSKGPCGYCKSSGYTSISHGLWAHAITVDDYQDLLDRGWRRSGSYLYKPEMDRTCCPSYTIRLKASEFVPSKEQNRVLKKMKRFLEGTLDLKNPLLPNGEKNSTDCLGAEANRESASRMVSEPCEDDRLRLLASKIDDAVKACYQDKDFPQLPQASAKRVAHKNKTKLKEISEGMVYTSAVAFQIAATIRRDQDTPRIAAGRMGGSCSSSSDPSPCDIAERLAHTMRMQEDGSSEMEVRACNGHLNFYSSAEKAAGGDVARTPQSAKDGSAGNGEPPLQHRTRRLEIRMNRSAFDAEEFELYRRYQIRVQNDRPDKITKSQYSRFLVETPLRFVPGEGKHGASVPPCGFGSFHQQYRIDGKLVAVGVLDVLPRCLSSKYLFWDPDLAFLSLGKYSALREIEWVRQSELRCPSLQYYYLGYYIHSCSKMRYKAAYHPSELLCPLRYEWVPFRTAKTILDQKPYAVLSDYASVGGGASSPRSPMQDDSVGSASAGEMEVELESRDDDEEDELEAGAQTAPDVRDIVLESDGTRVKFKHVQRLFGPIPLKDLHSLELQLRRYARAVGGGLAGGFIYRLN